MTPFLFFLYSLALAGGLLVVGLAGLAVFALFCLLVAPKRS